MFRRSHSATSVIVVLAVACFGGSELTTAVQPAAAPASEPTRNLTFFLRWLRTLEHLPALEDSHTAMASTWDRSGQNFDGWDFKRIEDGHNVLFQFQRNIRVTLETMGSDGFGTQGDTIIHRDHPIWSTTAYWYAWPIQPADSTPVLVQPR